MLARLFILCVALLAFDAARVLAAGKVESLPPETATLRASSLPGFTIAQQRCSICHSADYIELQPPGMSVAQWTAEMVKMQRTYGAPLEEREIPLLAEYLGAAYAAPAAASTP